MSELTNGFFDQVLRRGHQPGPSNLQIMAMKEIASQDKSVRRYRIQLSDACMYTGTIEMSSEGYPVIATTKYNVTDLPRSGADGTSTAKKLLVIQEFNVVSTPGSVLGNPQLFKLDQAPLMARNPNPASTTTAPPSAMSSRPAASNVPPAAANARSTVAYGAGAASNTNQQMGVFPISALTPYQNKWKIRARCTNKSDIRTWSNARGEGKLFSMDLTDETGEIRCTAFKSECDKFYSLVQVNSVYYISGGQIKQANKKFTSIKNDYEITLSAQSEITPCYDQSIDAIPTHMYNFTKFDQLEKSIGESVDVIGVVKTVAEAQKIMTKKQEELTKRDVTIVDDSNKAVTITMWGERAEKFEVYDEVPHPVIALKGCSVREFQGGVSLSVAPSTVYEIEPQLQQAYALRSWFDQTGYLQETTSISKQAAGSGAASQVKLIAIADILRLGESQQTADYFNVRAQVMMINRNSENVLYKACPKENCNKKVVELGPGSYRCEKCNEDTDRFKFRALLSIQVSDFSGSHWISMFTESVEQMTGTTVDKIGELKEASDPEYEKIFDNVLFKKFIFRIRAKTEIYNDESRVKWTVQQVRLNDVEQEIKQLKEMIAKLETV